MPDSVPAEALRPSREQPTRAGKRVEPFTAEEFGDKPKKLKEEPHYTTKTFETRCNIVRACSAPTRMACLTRMCFPVCNA